MATFVVKSDSSLTREFFAHVEDKLFPCVGAKSALATNGIATLACRDITSAWDDLRIHEALCAFGRTDKAGAGPATFRSFAVLFQAPSKLDEQRFETAMWDRLQSLCEKDAWLSYRPDRRVATDPNDPDFAFSVGGAAYFVVGMHPAASRASRRTPMPALVFNPFSQFQLLRDDGRYTRMSDVIRARDEAACGAPNPMLAHHGEASAARQFSGRITGADWICPLSGRSDG